MDRNRIQFGVEAVSSTGRAVELRLRVLGQDRDGGAVRSYRDVKPVDENGRYLQRLVRELVILIQNVFKYLVTQTRIHFKTVY